VIVNKVHYDVAAAHEENGTDVEESLAATLGAELAAKVASTHSDFQALAKRDRRNVQRLAAEMQTSCVIQVPYLDEDVHDLAGLMEINRYLFASGAEERVALAAER